MKRILTVSAACLAAATFTTLSTQGAYAAPPAPKQIEVRGDSLPAGTGSLDVPFGILPNGTVVGNVLNNPALVEPGTEGRCYRTTEGYPGVIGRHPELQVNNKSCPGLTVAEFDTGKFGEPPQYEGLSAETAAVMLGMGANTIRFPDLAACVASDDCRDGNPVVEDAKILLRALPEMLLEKLLTTRKYAPNAWIIPVSYPEVFGKPGPLGWGCLGLVSDNPDPNNRGERQVADSFQQGLNAAWVWAIEQFKLRSDHKIEFLEITNDFVHPAGYEQVEMYFDACSTGIGDLVNGFDSDITRANPFHLNLLGSQAVGYQGLALFRRIGLISS